MPNSLELMHADIHEMEENMELDKIIALIHTVSESSLTKFSLEDGDLKISMKTNKETKVMMPPQPAPYPVAAPGPMAGHTVPMQAPSSSLSVSVEEAKEERLSGNIVTAPLVGTFYHSPSPDADAFVKVGDRVKKGQVLGIVEAMKLMNEIESEFDGIVEQILVKNESVVEYNQPLFVIK